MILDIISDPTPVGIILTIFSYLIILIICFPIHESAHALMAKWLGDTTAEEQGRITLNPLAHLDPIGTGLILLFGFGWAKAVPVRPYRARKVSQKTAMILTAAAGPISNIIVSLVFLIIGKIILVVSPLDNDIITWLFTAIRMVIHINLGLAAFNLLPIPPLDGFHIFLSGLSPKMHSAIIHYQREIWFILLIVIGTNLLDKPISIISNLIYTGLDFITGFIC